MFVFTNEILYEGRGGAGGGETSDRRAGRLAGPGGSAERTDPLLFLLADVETGSIAPATRPAPGGEVEGDGRQAGWPGGGHPLLSQDGGRISAEYVDRETATARVVCVDLDRERMDELARFRVRDHSHQGTHIHPTWSRDGRQLLFNVDESGHSELWVALDIMGP